MNKLDWLKWAEGQGLIECETKGDCTHWYVNSLKSPLVADEVDGKIEFYPTFMLVVLDWIDERGWVVDLKDVPTFGEQGWTKEITYSCSIGEVKLHWIVELGKSCDAGSRLEALLEAFKEAAENG